MKKLQKLSIYIIFIQLFILVVIGSIDIFRFEIWAPIDEGAHFNYIQYLAENKKVPVLGENFTSKEVLSIEKDKRAKLSLRHLTGKENYSYEAFQPPLYYTLALLPFSCSDNFYHKVFCIRFFDLILLFSAVFIYLQITKLVFPKRWMFVFSLGLSFMLFPSVVVRSITISNFALKLPLPFLFIYFILKYSRSYKLKYLIASNITLALMLLTKKTLVYFTAVYITYILYEFLKTKDKLKLITQTLISLLFFFIVYTPWIVFNLKTYGSINKADVIARKIQRPIVNPENKNYTVLELPQGITRLSNTLVLPEEWSDRAFSNRRPYFVRIFLAVIFSILAVLFIAKAVTSKLTLRPRMIILFLLPFLYNLAMLIFVYIYYDWPVLLGRYLTPSFLLLPIGLVLGYKADKNPLIF